MNRYSLPLFIIIVIFFASCYYDNQEALYPSLTNTCDTTNVTYSGTIAPIMSNNCTSCHSGGAPAGSISLTSYANVQTVAASGALMNALTGTGVPAMPPSGSLSACKISQVQIWIKHGMPNN
jgi:cytochrome c5